MATLPHSLPQDNSMWIALSNIFHVEHGSGNIVSTYLFAAGDCYHY